MKTYIFADNSRIGRGQIMVRVFSDGSATLSFRDNPAATWGPPTYSNPF